MLIKPTLVTYVPGLFRYYLKGLQTGDDNVLCSVLSVRCGRETSYVLVESTNLSKRKSDNPTRVSPFSLVTVRQRIQVG